MDTFVGLSIFLNESVCHSPSGFQEVKIHLRIALMTWYDDEEDRVFHANQSLTSDRMSEHRDVFVKDQLCPKSYVAFKKTLSWWN